VHAEQSRSGSRRKKLEKLLRLGSQPDGGLPQADREWHLSADDRAELDLELPEQRAARESTSAERLGT
jgi:hypothetical protein